MPRNTRKVRVFYQVQTGVDEEPRIKLRYLLSHFRPDYCTIKREIEEELIC